MTYRVLVQPVKSTFGAIQIPDDGTWTPQHAVDLARAIRKEFATENGEDPAVVDSKTGEVFVSHELNPGAVRAFAAGWLAGVAR